jgi:hypothetical protein
MKPIASLIVRNHIKSLGESIETFPQARLPELVSRLTQDVSDENVKTAFRERLESLSVLTPA